MDVLRLTHKKVVITHSIVKLTNQPVSLLEVIVIPQIGTLRSTTATSTNRKRHLKISLRFIIGLSRVILSHSILTIWAEYPYNKLVRALSK